MINQNTMDMLDRLGFGSDVDALEEYVGTLQDSAGAGTPLVTDTQYDIYVNLLRELKPASNMLNRNWEKSDYELGEDDEILLNHRMYSIETIQHKSEISKFKEALERVGEADILASTKLNGHAIRAVYRNGVLIGGSTRGRTKKGRNISRHLKAVLPNIVDEWKGIRILEVRGEMLVSHENFEYLKDTLKTRLSAVTSLIRDSVTDGELKLLSCVCYKIITCNDSEVKYNTLYEQFQCLARNGFEVPICKGYSRVTSDLMDRAFDDILESFSQLEDDGKLKYDCDGIVVAVNDNEVFSSMGTEGNHCIGNFAIKMGRHWECNIYKGIIREVQFVAGKKYLTPKAIIEPVVTANGATVTTVPLYNVGVMNDLHLIPEEEIYFRFGGETGVTLCTANGTLISELDR